MAYAAWHSMGALSAEEIRTGTIFGFLKRVLSLAKEFKTNQFIFCWDSRRSRRKLIYPEYKANRRQQEPSPEERKENEIKYHQFDLLRTEILPALGFKNNYRKFGYEADDLIAHFALTSPVKELDNNIVVSSDNDLFQLLNLCTIYSLYKKQLYTRNDFIDEWGVDPGVWWRVKAIAGCSTDNVEGIKGVGEKTAIRYLHAELPENGVVCQRIDSEEGQKIIERNIPLVRLPFTCTTSWKNLAIKKDDFRRNNFLDVFDNYRFQSFLNNFQEWEKVFDI
jgi:5'-3' exonuclease